MSERGLDFAIEIDGGINPVDVGRARGNRGPRFSLRGHPFSEAPTTPRRYARSAAGGNAPPGIGCRPVERAPGSPGPNFPPRTANFKIPNEFFGLACRSPI